MHMNKTNNDTDTEKPSKRGRDPDSHKHTDLTFCGVHRQDPKTWMYKTKDTNPYPDICRCEKKKNIPKNIHIHLYEYTKKSDIDSAKDKVITSFTEHNTTKHNTQHRVRRERESEREHKQ